MVRVRLPIPGPVVEVLVVARAASSVACSMRSTSDRGAPPGRTTPTITTPAEAGHIPSHPPVNQP